MYPSILEFWAHCIELTRDNILDNAYVLETENKLDEKKDEYIRRMIDLYRRKHET